MSSGNMSASEGDARPLPENIRRLAQRIEQLRAEVRYDERIIIALAGVPGSGKSTVCATLLAHLRKEAIEDVAVVPMDGFHYTKAKLATFPDPAAALRRRGAPFTFNAEAFVAAVKAIKSSGVTRNHDPAHGIALPGFDHAVQDPVPGEILIPSTTRVVVLEGNYTLLNEAPWDEIAAMANETWFVDVPREVAKSRLAQRHLLAGIETTMPAAEARVEANDMRNADEIVEKLIKPDVSFQG